MLAAHLAGLGCLKGNSFGFKGAGIPSNFSPPRDGFCFHHKRNLKMFKGKGSPQIISNHQKKSETTTKKKKIRIVFWTFKTFKTFKTFRLSDFWSPILNLIINTNMVLDF